MAVQGYVFLSDNKTYSSIKEAKVVYLTEEGSKYLEEGDGIKISEMPTHFIVTAVTLPFITQSFEELYIP